MDAFWNREHVRDLTNEETEILCKIEKRIEKRGECFIHPKLVQNDFEKKQIRVRSFVFGIFMKEELSIKDLKIYVRCNEKECVNPAHFILTTPVLAIRLQKIEKSCECFYHTYV